jgi:phenylacetate-CoA ligase
MIDKRTIQANFPDRIVSDRLDWQTLYKIGTSGTTDRVMLFHDEPKRDWDRAADLSVALEGNGYRPGQRQALIPPDACYERCGADEHGRTIGLKQKINELGRSNPENRTAAAREVLSLFMRDVVWRVRIFQALGVDGTATNEELLNNYLDDLRQWRPHLLSGLPEFLYILGLHANGPRPGNGRIATLLRSSGGKITSEMVRVVERSFGGRVRESYGTAELGTIAHDCENNRRQHLFEQLFYIEFVRGDRQVGPNELGEVVITDLRNHAAPLIRYRVGDVGRWFEGPCGCGRNGMLFTIDGRLQETIVTPTGSAFPRDQLVDFFISRPAIHHAKVLEQAPDRFLVEYVPAENSVAAPDDDQISSEFGDFLGTTVNVRMRSVRRISPERSGKFRLVDSKSHTRFHDHSSPMQRREVVCHA